MTLAAAAIAVWALAPPVEAYLDPGTGSTLLQGVIGTVAIAAGLLSHYWHRLRTFFSGAASLDRGHEHDG